MGRTPQLTNPPMIPRYSRKGIVDPKGLTRRSTPALACPASSKRCRWILYELGHCSCRPQNDAIIVVALDENGHCSCIRLRRSKGLFFKKSPKASMRVVSYEYRHPSLDSRDCRDDPSVASAIADAAVVEWVSYISQLAWVVVDYQKM
jgi:hypothetical protein